MNPDRLHYLMQQYIKNECTKGELNELLAFIKEDRNQDLLRDELHNYWDDIPVETGDAAEWDKRFAAMMEESKAQTSFLDADNRIHRKPLLRVAVAALSLLILAAGIFHWFGQGKKPGRQLATANNDSAKYENDVPPGGHKATLTLSDGSTIVLDSIRKGSVAYQGNSKILKTDSGRLEYTAGAAHTEAAAVFNTISTPRGGQYAVVLADGSKVWLNAASSLRFPTSFTGRTREVTLTGEGYFEIAPDKEKPFSVRVGSARIEVLGTHFNVMAYDAGNDIETTLLEGAVKMRYADKAAILKPGQQAVLNTGKGTIRVEAGNIDGAIAWKNGLFQFDNSNLETIMKQIARWYDVEVVYEDETPSRRFTGKMSRNVSLQHVLKVLELSKVNFKLDGRKIIVFQ